jgi:predicted RNase H-like HicB family nuclease
VKVPHYHINLFWSDEDGFWIADVPDLKHCSSHGDTPEEAIANIQAAMEGWIETARETGLEIPNPRYRPAIYAARDAA